MKLVTFRVGSRPPAAGMVVEGRAVDAAAAARALSLPPPEAASVRGILAGGEPELDRLRRIEEAVRRAAGSGDSPAWATPLDDVELLAPVPDPEKVVCVGQNYIDHCREQNVEPPKSPVIFAKFASTLTGPRSDVFIPPSSLTVAVDYEVELAFVFGRECRKVPRAEAVKCVAGYMVMNDVTARDIQKGDGQWVRGKSVDSFGPCGPWLLTRDEIPDPHRLRIGLELNGATMQDSSTENLIFDIPFLIEYLSRSLTFRPGDIVSTGTPPGVGAFRKPPVFLAPGDEMVARIEGIGELRNRCVADDRPPLF